jgi:hypothetical protein
LINPWSFDIAGVVEQQEEFFTSLNEITRVYVSKINIPNVRLR